MNEQQTQINDALKLIASEAAADIQKFRQEIGPLANLTSALFEAALAEQVLTFMDKAYNVGVDAATTLAEKMQESPNTAAGWVHKAIKKQLRLEAE